MKRQRYFERGQEHLVRGQGHLHGGLEHGDEGKHRVEKTAGVGHQQLLVSHLQRRHKQLNKKNINYKEIEEDPVCIQ